MTAEVVATATNESTIGLLTLVAPVSGTVSVKKGDTVHVWVTSSSLLGVPSYLVQDLLGTTLAIVGTILEDTVANRTLAMYRDEAVEDGDRSWTFNLGLLRTNVGIHVVVMRGMESPSASDGAGMIDDPSASTLPDGVTGVPFWNTYRGIQLCMAYDTSAARTPAVGSGFTDLGAMWGFGGTNRARSQYRMTYTQAPQSALFSCTNPDRFIVGNALYRENSQVFLGASAG